MATKKTEKEPTTKPDFRKGDRVSGVVSYTVERQRAKRMVRIPQMDDPKLHSYAVERAMREVERMSDRYDEGFEVQDTYQRVGNKAFYTVVTPPYKAQNKWHMTVRGDDGEEQEVFCKDFHLVGERTIVEPLINKETKEKIVKLTKPAIVTGIVIGVIVIIGLWLAGNYNSLVVANNAVDNSKAKIDTQLERRYELIDNIVSSVEGSQAQESDVFGKIAEARKVGSSATSESAEAEANATIDQQIQLLPRLQEAYPELRSNDQVTRLIQELQGTAGQVATARDTYNDTVTNYNNNITSFPKNIFANLFNFEKKELFKASTEARTNPQVKIERP